MTDSKSRLRWMDTVRGLAILLVIVWHSVAIPALFGYDMPVWLRSINDFFLPFRMPALMFLSGFLLQKSLKKPLKSYYTGKLKMLVWPYLIWALIHLNMYEYQTALFNPRSWIATGYLWFLFYITCFYFVAPIVRSINPGLVAIAMALGSLVAPEGLINHFLYFGTFFFAGHWAGVHSERFERILASKRWVAIAGLLALSIGAASSIFGKSLAYRAELAIFSMGGVVFIIWAVKSIQKRDRISAISFIGERSIVYYVTHFPLMLGMFYIFKELGVGNIELISISGILISLTVGWAMARWYRTPPIKWLFQAPHIPGTARKQVGQPRPTASGDVIRTDETRDRA
ncbi:acyltransferase family protein [Rhodococcus sp. 5G237]